jgi:hypothetical protein
MQAFVDHLPEKVKRRVIASHASMRHGLSTVAPMRCAGPPCILIQHCPIPPRDDYGRILVDDEGSQDYGPQEYYPVGGACLLEHTYMQQRLIDYVQHLEINPSNPVEMAIANELAVIDLYKNRALMILSAGDKRGQGKDLLMTDVTGFSEHGYETTSTQLHPAADFIEKLEKRRERWLDRMVETRKSKIDAQSRLGNLGADNALLEEIRIVRTHLEKLKNEPTLLLEEIELD